ncbi:F-box domain-containing protein [Heracleum sosnowskyi]|uniref:F-box domain-containing protein n=1 Tax=Heracleum sosnowskyi TaxID=360622 RepID=A0AAD8IC93_9APIA|nr:F-box domain-containing protein [Heracleum sosnowskyi]
MELPYELVDEILYRVDVKHLLRCRCVSKRWCSVIDSNEFVKNHLKASIERNGGGILIRSKDKSLLADIESFDNGTAAIDISGELKRILNTGAVLVGSANGLFCVRLIRQNVLFLLNPCTRKFKKLPIVPTEDWFNCYGFGYDRVNDDYKVVIMEQRYRPTPGIMPIVYSLKGNTWAPITNAFTTENISFFGTIGMFVDGALHWKATNITSMSSMVVGFDLGLEQFREAKYCNGNMVLMNISMENSLVQEISANPVFTSFRSPRLLMYSKSLKKILFEVDGQKFVWYHLKSKAFKNVSTIPAMPAWFNSYMYIESLFPLVEDKQPSHEAKEKEQHQKKKISPVL